RDPPGARRGGVPGDELNGGPAVQGRVSVDPAHVEPFDAEPEVVHVEVASFANVWDGQVRGDAGGLHEWLLLSVAVRAAIVLRSAESVQLSAHVVARGPVSEAPLPLIGQLARTRVLHGANMSRDRTQPRSAPPSWPTTCGAAGPPRRCTTSAMSP